MTDKKTNRRIVTPPFRAAFPKLFKPDSMPGSEKEFYSVEAVFPPDTDLTAMKQLAARVAKEHWGDKIPKRLESPFRSGNDYNEERENPRPELEDCTFIRLKTSNKPDVVEKNPNVFITDESEIYSGCWMRASVYCHPYDNRQNPQQKNGVTFLLNHVQKLKDDEPWGTPRKSAAKDFDDELSDKSEAQNEFADNGSGDDIPW